MNKDIERKFYIALNKLLDVDKYLLTNDVNERSISHRLAIYLESSFSGWNVDCEYNRNEHNIKRLEIQKTDLSSDDTNATTVYPDIIIHKRGTQENHLVIEMKKTTSHVGDSYDIKKLAAFKKQLDYKFAIFLKLKTGADTASIERLEWID